MDFGGVLNVVSLTLLGDTLLVTGPRRGFGCNVVNPHLLGVAFVFTCSCLWTGVKVVSEMRLGEDSFLELGVHAC